MINNVFQGKAKILSNQKIGRGYCRLALECPEVAGIASPGQFVEVKACDSLDPLLRRPFGVHKVRGKAFEILIEIVGKATQILSRKKPGGYLDIIGPLGNGFDLSQYSVRSERSILIAGGMGVAPLVFLAEKLVHNSQLTTQSKLIVLIGAREKSHILCENEFRRLGCEVRIATDDGSKGRKGKVTDLLNPILSTLNTSTSLSALSESRHSRDEAKGCRLSAVYACGPKPMLKEVSRSVKLCRLPAQLSLEAHMCCGIGACLGCVVKTLGGYKRVCKEGPVFSAREIIWD